ncbi:MAG: hypothetical protein N4A47_02470 [Clostridia bacterium]|jgi:hypothetical protein|nr:hypothetical protein [Clostridia bacterium]
MNEILLNELKKNDLNTYTDFFNFLSKDMTYGWVDNLTNIYYSVDENFASNYILQTPIEVFQKRLGICWDKSELVRAFLDTRNYLNKAYFYVFRDSPNEPCHSFNVIIENNEFIWLELSGSFKGIHKYNTLDDLLSDARKKIELHLSTVLNVVPNNYRKEAFELYEYNAPKNFHISASEWFKNCYSGNKIAL